MTELTERQRLQKKFEAGEITAHQHAMMAAQLPPDPEPVVEEPVVEKPAPAKKKKASKKAKK